MKKIIILTICVLLLSTGCSNKGELENNNEETKVTIEKDSSKEDDLINEKYKNEIPIQWGEHIEGVTNNFDTENKQIALTLDACGGKEGSNYDKELIDFLEEENIPATLFINYRWIMKNEDIFLELSKNPKFEIENHGYSHKPLSVNGNSIYNIEGTKNVREVTEEIKLNEDKVYELTGIKTKFFRSGTAYYDEVAINICEELNYKIAGFSINGDGGATFTKEQVMNEVLKSRSGDIIISHFNRPNGETYEGLKEALIGLKQQGYVFMKLEDVVK
ncbi:MAG: polysaccharide deacetylase family protein [Terrisporobacter sp.]